MIRKRDSNNLKVTRLRINNKISENQTISHISQSLQTTIMQGKVDNNEKKQVSKQKQLEKRFLVRKREENNSKLNK